MTDERNAFDWAPFYQQLADKLAQFRAKQQYLISFLEELRTKGLKISTLQDRDETGRRFLLNEIDPFTFFGTFNRGITSDRRVAILREMKAQFQVPALVPSDFSGVPVLNNMKSWFVSSSYQRKDGDVAKLWNIFEAALQSTPSEDDSFSRAFDAALSVRNTNINLTMGLFWVRPYTFLSLDKANQEYLDIKIPKEGLSFAFYKSTLEKVRTSQKEDFLHVSRSAWLSAKEPVIAGDKAPPKPVKHDIDYWLVGAYWDDQEPADQTERFLTEGVWENGYKDKYLEQVRLMKVGDKVAIKATFTQKHDLPFDNRGKTISGMTVKATGTVVKNLGDGHTIEVDWDPTPDKQRIWYFYTYQQTIWHLRKEDDLANRLIRFVFFAEDQDYKFFIGQFMDGSTESNNQAQPYAVADMLADGVFLSENEIQQALNRWKTKKNLILQGAPGVGKTFIARKMAYALLKEIDPSRVVTVQFHPSFAYEDFVRGYRPTEQAGRFELVDGPMLHVCGQSSNDPDHKFVLLIDEINRANLAQVFGEFLMLLEADKRGAENAVTPLYRRDAKEKFHVPENLFVIGTMNIADRSLALVDYALRRRFAFLTLEPRFSDPAFRNWLKDRGMTDPLIQRIIKNLSALNLKIGEDSMLGPAYRIGHSFFCPMGTDFSHLDELWFQEVVQTEIRPLLLEYWYDAPQKAETAADELLT